MKGSQHPKNDITINPSCNESIRDVIARTDVSRRSFLKGVAAASAMTSLGSVLPRNASAAPIPATNGFGGIGFDSIPAKLAPVANTVEVPAGYTVEVLATWGQPIMPGAPDWNPDATQDAATQAMQFGMHCDGMHYFPFPTRTGPSSVRGIMAINNEYTQEEILHGSEGLLGGSGVTIAKVRKSQSAHGVSIVEVRKTALGKWQVVKNSSYGRRITANTPMLVSGPAAGHSLLQSKRFDILPTGSIEVGVNDGYSAFGTHNNCAHGYTPWGTYLTCEENWNGNFGWNATDPAPADPAVANGQVRYGLSAAGFAYNWHVADPRFNARTNPLEPHLYGWVVEIDPMNPNSQPVKRTALGRFKHESAQVAMSHDAQGVANRVAFYMGDDERNEYIYKFVCDAPFNPTNMAANRDLLDRGTLYVARFTSTPVIGKPDTYRGAWVALTPDTVSVIANGAGGFYLLRELGHFNGTGVNGAYNTDYADAQALILIKTRQAADAVGATMMDRPEWTAVRTYQGYGNQNYDQQRPLEIYCTLTNNNRRGNTPASSNSAAGTTGAALANPPVDLANPRPDNDYGHIIRWREDGNHVTATAFEWDIFALCGDTATTKTLSATYLSTNLVPGSGTGPFYEGNIADNPNGSADFGAPDGLWFDQFGRLWIQTDQAGDAAGDFANVGANVMCCADPNSKEIRRFLTSPRNCEVTGVVNTPDGRTLFVGIQHPGEGSTPTNPTQFSNWPQSQFSVNSAGEPLAVVGGVTQPTGAMIRPRSTVLVITKNDNGVIGA